MDAGPPLPFNQGGAARDINNPVQYYADGGAVQYFGPGGEVDADLKEQVDKRLGLFQELGLGSEEERSKALENQRRMSKSGMLFDIADAALRFAGTPIRPGMSLASTAAESLAASKLLPRISQRADKITEFEQKQLSDKRQMNLAALTQAETSLAAKVKSEAELVRQARGNAFQLAQLNLQQDFAKGENQSNREHALDLAQKKNEYQLTLQTIENDNSREAIRLRASLNEQLADINNKARSALAKDSLDQQLRIRNLNSADQFEQISIGHKNALSKLEKTKENEVERMKLNQQYTIQRDDHLAGIAEVAAETEMVFRAKEAALGRLQTWDVTKFNAELSKELQKNGFDESAIDREIKKTQQNFDNVLSMQEFDLKKKALEVDKKYKEASTVINQSALSDSQKQQIFNNILTMKQFEVQKGTADANQKYNAARLKIEQSQLSNAEKQQVLNNILSIEGLDLQKASLAVDKTYKEAKTALDAAAAAGISLDNKGDTLKYISNEERIEAYGRNELGENTSLFETVLADYFKEKPGSWDGANYVMNPAPKLPAKLIEAIKQRQAYVGANPDDKLSVPNFTGDVGLDGTVEAVSKVVFDPENPPSYGLDRGSWNKALFSGKNGSVQLDKNFWASVPTNIASDVDYTAPIGLSAIPLNFIRSYENLGFEIGLLEKISDGTIEFSEGQKDLTLLANRILLSATNLSDERVLKVIQLEIQKEVENIKPGILQYSTDTGASLNAVAKQLAGLIQKASEALPEYNGKLGDRSKKTIDKRRLLMDDTVGLLAEVLKVRDNFYSSFQDSSKSEKAVQTKEKNVGFLKGLKKRVLGEDD